MKLRLLLLAGVVLLGACATRVPRDTPHAVAAGCAAGAAREAGDARIRRAIDEARRQHELFGAQTIEENGGLFVIGQHEASWSRAGMLSLPAWRRVLGFWSSVPASRALGVSTSAGRVPLPLVAPPAPSAGGVESGSADVAAHEALLRAAVMDTPWSAVFISHLMRHAGLTDGEFEFSASHADYVRAAFDATAAEAGGRAAAHAFRACDVATTRPRAGDLLCATRAGTADIQEFRALSAVMAAPAGAFGFPMHCDLVVRADPDAEARLEAIGGNVLSSVTLSRMRLDAGGLLAGAYVADPVLRGCARGGAPCEPHLSRRPWVVLLQFRH